MSKNIDISDKLRLFDALSDLGINKKQAKVYLALLRLGKQKVGVIAKMAQEKRTTTYHHLEYLENRGLISISRSGKQSFYQANKPQVLQEIVNDQQQSVKYLIPQLDKISKGLVATKIEVFEGGDILRLLNKVLNCRSKKIYCIWREGLIKETSGHSYHFNKKRAEKGIFSQALYPRQTIRTIEQLKEKQTIQLMEIKLLPEEIKPDMRMILFDQSAALLSPREGFGMIINSKKTYEMWLSLFKMLWQVSKKI